MLLDLLFPNRCLHCNSIISKEELVCEVCFPQIKFYHYHFYEENPLKNRCKLLFPVENAFALMQFEKEGLSQKIIHSLKYGNREKVGKILAEWTSERLNFENEKIDLKSDTIIGKRMFLEVNNSFSESIDGEGDKPPR